MCENDFVQPLCVFPSGNIIITYINQNNVPGPLSVDMASYGDVTAWQDPFWDDCEAPNNASLTDIVTDVTRNLVITVGYPDSDHTPQESGTVVGQYTDSDIGSTIFQPRHDDDGDSGSDSMKYKVSYDITDREGLSAQTASGGPCEFTVTVIDNSPPECNEASNTPIAPVTNGVSRGTLVESWSVIDPLTLIPSTFSISSSYGTNLIPDIMSHLRAGLQGTDWAMDLALWTLQSFDSAGNPTPSNAQSFAFCDELVLRDGQWNNGINDPGFNPEADAVMRWSVSR